MERNQRMKLNAILSGETELEYPLGSIHPYPCPDCGARLILAVYNGWLAYFCEHCKCAAGAHIDTGKPYGRPANKDVRVLRILLHKLIDPWWKGQKRKGGHPAEARTQIYQLMSEQLEVKQFHIAKLSEAQLRQAIEIAQREIPKLF